MKDVGGGEVGLPRLQREVRCTSILGSNALQSQSAFKEKNKQVLLLTFSPYSKTTMNFKIGFFENYQ